MRSLFAIIALVISITSTASGAVSARELKGVGDGGGDDVRPYNEFLCRVKVSDTVSYGFWIGSQMDGFTGAKTIDVFKYVSGETVDRSTFKLGGKTHLAKVGTSYRAFLLYTGTGTGTGLSIKIDTLGPADSTYGVNLRFKGWLTSQHAYFGTLIDQPMECVINDAGFPTLP